MGRPLIRSFANDFMLQPTTEAQFWILGWFYSDGNVSKKLTTASVTVHSRDVEVLEKMKTIMRAPAPISHRKDGNACIFKVNSRHLCRSLVALGCVPAKSLIITYPTCVVTRDQHRAFLRGVFEGDGSFYPTGRRASAHAEIASGSLVFLEQLKMVILEQAGLETSIGYTLGKPRRLHIIGGVHKVAHFMSYLYDGVSVELSMNRKRESWLRFKAVLASPPPARTWQINAARRTAFYIKDPRGQVYHSNTVSPFAWEYGLEISPLHAVIMRKPHYHSTRGWRAPSQEEIDTSIANGTLITKDYPLLHSIPRPVRRAA